MLKPTPLVSGTWREEEQLEDYRSEWLSNVLVERATWKASAQPVYLAEVVEDVTIAAPGYVWLRFWLRDEEQVVDKYFDDEGKVVGFYIPVCMPFRQKGEGLQTQALAMAVWHDEEGKLTILGESEFESGQSEEVYAPVEIEHAEHRVRELTLGILNRTFPPGLIRNFSVAVE